MAGKKELFHGNCFRCTDCNALLEMHTFGSDKGIVYCANHHKAHVNLSKWENLPTPTNFVPVEKALVTERKETPDSVAQTVKKFKEGADTNKCAVCGKAVYLAEKMDVEMKGEKKLYHKICFKCSVCSVHLELRTFDSQNGILYCKTHLPQIQQDKFFFFSPMKTDTEEILQKIAFEKVEHNEDLIANDRPPVKGEAPKVEPKVEQPKPKVEPVVEQPQQEDEQEAVKAEAPVDPEVQRDEERKKRREEIQKKRAEEEKKEEEDRLRREKEREERKKNAAADNDTETGTDDEKKKQREERRRLRDEAAKKEEEEAEKKSEERRKRLEQVKKERQNS